MNGPIFTIILSPLAEPHLRHLDTPIHALHRPSQVRADIRSMMANTTGRVDLLYIATPAEIHEFLQWFPSQRSRRLRYAFVAFSLDGEDIEGMKNPQGLLDLRTGTITPTEFKFIQNRAMEHFTTRDTDRIRDWQARDNTQDQQALITIGKALAYERDPDNLLRSILHLAKKITGADAGSIFITETGEEGPRLRFKHSHTFSKDLAYEEFTLPQTDSSIAGYVANHAQVLNIPDVYFLEPGTPYSFNKSFDLKNGYRTKSMIAVPLVNPAGKVLGVLQLLNCKEVFDQVEEFSGNEAFEVQLLTEEDFNTKVAPFESRYESLLEAVAGQAAIAMENTRLFLQIEKQFEVFVEASVRAIEARDPATAGHSFRVSKTSELLAQAVHRQETGPLSQVYFSEKNLKQLTMACLLHDFGKVYIDYNLFSKAKKLTPEEFQVQDLRWDLLHRTLELKHQKMGSPPQENSELEVLATLRNQARSLAEPAPRPTSATQEIEALLEQTRDWNYQYPDGRPLEFLTPKEAENLKIPRGSLTNEERLIIQSHVVHSYNFVKNIPWPEEFSKIPEFVRMHHELLDGSGYPQGLKADMIPLEARIMTISDIFDALAASDRPYKKALPIPQVLAILKEDAQAGKLDSDLLDIFIAEEVYKTIYQGAD